MKNVKKRKRELVGEERGEKEEGEKERREICRDVLKTVTEIRVRVHKPMTAQVCQQSLKRKRLREGILPQCSGNTTL